MFTVSVLGMAYIALCSAGVIMNVYYALTKQSVITFSDTAYTTVGLAVCVVLFLAFGWKALLIGQVIGCIGYLTAAIINHLMGHLEVKNEVNDEGVEVEVTMRGQNTTVHYHNQTTTTKANVDQHVVRTAMEEAFDNARSINDGEPQPA